MVNKLAIIIPFYKKKYFRDTLESLAKQTDKNFSLYIGNDNSPENIDDLLHDYKQKLKFTYQKFNDNLGAKHLTKQWDRCISLSENEDWIMILGDDDFVDNNFVEEFHKNLDYVIKSKINVMRFSSQLINEKGEKTSKVFTNPILENPIKSYIRTLSGNGRSTLTEHIFSRPSYKKYGFRDFPVGFGSDNVAWIEFPDGKGIFSINTSVAYIRISKEHLSSKNDELLKYKRKEGIYLFNRYLIENYGSAFSNQEKRLILKKTYKNLRFYSRDKIKTSEFIFFMIKKIGWDAFRIVRNNSLNR